MRSSLPLGFLTLLVLVKASFGYIMTCPQLDEYSDDADENIAWVCDFITWRNKLAHWKWNVEKKCSVSDAERYWRSAFRCPDFSDVKCEDKRYRHTETDLFDCPVTFCVNGRYRDDKSLRRAWRRHMTDYKKLMKIYSDKLGSCWSSNCPQSTQGIPFTTFSPPVGGRQETTMPYTHYDDEPTTTTEECVAIVTSETMHHGNFYDGCKTSAAGGCFWSDIRDSWSIDYYEAERICAAYGSVLAIISNEDTYNTIRSAIGNVTSYAVLWLGMTINPSTKEVCPRGSFTEYWFSTSPYSNPADTKIALIVDPSSEVYNYNGMVMVFEGYINYNPNTGTYGALCWKPQSNKNPETTISTSATSPSNYATETTESKPGCNETITPETIQLGYFSDECRTSPAGGCFWADIRDTWSIDFYEAEKICAANYSVLAIISDEITYSMLTASIGNMTAYADLWLGMTLNENTRDVCPGGSFAKYWYSTFPHPSPGSTKISLAVNPSTKDYSYEGIVFEGFMNNYPQDKKHGAICWKPRNSTKTSTSKPFTVTAVNSKCNQTITNQTIHTGPVSENCKNNTSGECFWIDIRDPWSIGFDEAERICSEYQSVLAVIPDESTYQMITDAIGNAVTSATVWLGTTYDPATNELCPLGSFGNYWYSTGPYRSPGATKVAIIVNRTPSAESMYGRVPFEGYINYDPASTTYGAVCWKPKLSN